MTTDEPRGLAERPLRIWQVCESYPPQYGGGAALAAKDITELLARRGHHVRVLTTEANPGVPDYSVRTEYQAGVQIDRLNHRYLVSQDPDGLQLGMRSWMR